MLFFIYGTDAPLYHYPITTTVMVVVNVLVHCLIAMTGYDVAPWILHFGDGLHPLQWVTHNFLHAGWFHLIFNMLFLFPFGMVVEGKLGWLRMFVLYMAIATGQGLSQQLIMLPSDPQGVAEELVEIWENPDLPMDAEKKEELTAKYREDLIQEDFGSLGASAAIYGLMAICAIWAPVNEFNVFFRWSPFIAIGGSEREWSTLTVAGIFVAQDLGMFLIMGMPISTEMLHLNGFIVGGAIGLAMLYYGRVDCEGFDLISHWTGEKFVAERIRVQQETERLERIEAAKPKGPPQAVVPKLMPIENASAPPAVTPIPTTIVRPPSRAAIVTPQSVDNGPGLIADPTLPEFDDAVPVVDPRAEAIGKIEALIARGEFTTAVRLLAESRKRDRDFITSAVSVGRLSEGLIRQNHIKPALSVLAIGSEAFPAYAPKWRVRAAMVELSVNKDAIAAIKQLREVDREMMDSATRTQYLKVAEQAKRLAEQGG